jgi:hypothetical protein
MNQHRDPLEPTNVQRAQWAKAALTVFTAETYGGDHPDTMDSGDLETAIPDLICDLMHFARFHPRMDAAEMHAHALRMFEQEIAEEANCDCTMQREGDNSAKAVPEWLDALLDVKRLAEKSGDQETDPFALLDLIADRARAAIANTNGGAI